MSQLQSGEERGIGFASWTLTKSECNYSVTKKEQLSLVFFAKHFRHYLQGKKFKIRTDHKSLTWLSSFHYPEDQVARWQAFLAEYDMEIVHHKGASHNNADSFSRRPFNEDSHLGSI